MTNIRKLLAALGILVLLFAAGWYFWMSTGRHGEGHVESHEHMHVHGQGIDHGHEHPEGSDDLKHSHAHEHDRHHHGEIEVPQPGLVEIGHSHGGSSKTTHFWAKLAVEDNGEFVLKFFASQDSELKTAAPSSSSLNAQILNGIKADGEANFEKSGDHFVAKLPENFLVLPTHVFKFQDLEFGDQKLDAFLTVNK